MVRAAVVAALAVLFALSGHALIPAQAALAGTGPGSGLKAVFIVGPSSGSTSEYIAQANGMARQAVAEGMTVFRVFTPHATWKRVLGVIQGANLVVYFGHGNGWPSPYPPFQEDTKDGLGLNPPRNAGRTAPVDYSGGEHIRGTVHLATNAVVVLYRLCYASGNAEQGMRPEYPNSPKDRNVATERVDNFAAGFLRAGAGVVFAWGWPQKINLPQRLAETDQTMDALFMDRANHTGSPNAFIGTDDYYRTSSRTVGAKIHLDPHRAFGHLRALSGNLLMTAGQFRGESVAPDSVAPRLALLQTAIGPAGAELASFSPNQDGIDDSLTLRHTVSEPAYIDTAIANAGGTTIRRIHQWYRQGPGVTTWNGRTNTNATVPDGVYHLSLTPSDKAGNVGQTVSVNARVLTTLRAPTRSTPAINVADRDKYARSVHLGVTLAHDARVSWTIVDAAGETVRTYLANASRAAGHLLWTWDGTDESGSRVPDGTYTAVVAATTAKGTVRYTEAVAVGPYRFRISDASPRRGERVRVSVYNTEPLAGAPRVKIAQPGTAAYSLRLRKLDGDHAAVHFSLKRAGKKGTMTIVITATDAGGQVETRTFHLRIH